MVSLAIPNAYSIIAPNIKTANYSIVIMSKFIKLSSRIINTKYIQYITIEPDKYYIELTSNSISGGFALFSSDKNEIKICENKNPLDYRILHDWIKKLD